MVSEICEQFINRRLLFHADSAATYRFGQRVIPFSFCFRRPKFSVMITANAVRRRGKPPGFETKCCVELIGDANSAPIKISVVGQLEFSAAELFEQHPASERRLSFDAYHWWAVCANTIRSFGEDTGILADINARITNV